MPLPDYLTPQDEDTVRARVLGRVPVERDVTEGSVLWEAISPTANEYVLLHDRLVYVFDLGFLDTTFGEFLDRKADERGLTRLPSTQAKATITFTGTVGTIIPVATEVSTPSTDTTDAQVFTTDAQVVIPIGGSVDVSATAQTPGAAGNVAANSIVLQVAPDPAITGVTNAAAATGGLDEETDDALRARVFERIRNPGSSGNLADYVAWAEAVPGVGRAAAVALPTGPGTVAVSLLGADLAPAAPGIVDDVQAIIAPGGANTGTGKAPVGAAVAVATAGTVVVNVAATLTIAAGYVLADVRTRAEAAITEYLQSIAFAADNDVRQARVANAILDTAGVVDVSAVTLNGGAANIVVGPTQVAVIGAVAWS